MFVCFFDGVFFFFLRAFEESVFSVGRRRASSGLMVSFHESRNQGRGVRRENKSEEKEGCFFLTKTKAKGRKELTSVFCDVNRRFWIAERFLCLFVDQSNND